MTTSGLIIIDKPAGMTSHDVVARVRRIVGTRKVGHAGTLDPMATGILVIGVERATKLLGYLTGHDKTYRAIVRLGLSTTTDDAEGESLELAAAGHITDAQIKERLYEQVGQIWQVPSSVSAIKVDGQRAYDRVRRGEDVQLKARQVIVHGIDVGSITREADIIDVEITVRCGPGTYIRSIARDLGAALEVGGHLTALRRTASGQFDESEALSLEQLAELEQPVVVSIDKAAASSFPVRQLSAADARELSFGRRLPAWGEADTTYAAIDPTGLAIALVDASGHPVVVFRPA